MLHKEIYNEIISVGERGLLDNITSLSKLFPIKSSDAWRLYDNQLVEVYDSQKLINLFKGLVICEKELQWHCGSTTPASHLYQDIKNRSLDPDHSLADWAFQYSDNEYIPFGFIRHGERSAYEYIQWRENYHNRLTQEKLDKEVRKEKQLERAARIKEQKKKRDLANRKFYQEILNLSPSDQINLILSDEKHILYFYMPIIMDLLENEDIESKDLLRLQAKLQSMKMTPFNKKLIKKIKKKRVHLFFYPKPQFTNSAEVVTKLTSIEKEVD